MFSFGFSLDTSSSTVNNSSTTKNTSNSHNVNNSYNTDKSINIHLYNCNNVTVITNSTINAPITVYNKQITLEEEIQLCKNQLKRLNQLYHSFEQKLQQQATLYDILYTSQATTQQQKKERQRQQKQLLQKNQKARDIQKQQKKIRESDQYKNLLKQIEAAKVKQDQLVIRKLQKELGGKFTKESAQFFIALSKIRQSDLMCQLI